MDLTSLYNSLKNDPGAIFVGGMWAIYVIATHILQNIRNTRQQEIVDRGSTSVITSLQNMATSANLLAQQERDRADRLSRENMELHAEVGRLGSDLRHCTEVRVEATEKLSEATETIEQLVVEIRSKDQSIARLVDMNRKILKSIGANVDTLDYVFDLPKGHPNEPHETKTDGVS